MDNSVRTQLIIIKERLNNACQVNKFKPPIFSFVWHFKQRIPTCTIGSKTFSAKNWMCDDNAKTIKLVEAVLLKINDNDYVAKHADALSGNFYPFDQVFDLSDEHKIIEIDFNIVM